MPGERRDQQRDAGDGGRAKQGRDSRGAKDTGGRRERPAAGREPHRGDRDEADTKGDGGPPENVGNEGVSGSADSGFRVFGELEVGVEVCRELGAEILCGIGCRHLMNVDLDAKGTRQR